MNVQQHIITRDEAVAAIAQHITARTAYIVGAAPDSVLPLAERLLALPSWTVYLDRGAPTVMLTDNPSYMALTALLSGPLCAVVIMPTSLPTELLDRAFGAGALNDSGLLTVFSGDGNEPQGLPQLFVDAMAMHDPTVVRAGDIRALVSVI